MRLLPQISGREVFEFNPELIEGDDQDASDDVYVRESDSDEEEEEVKLKWTLLIRTEALCIYVCQRFYWA